MAQNLSSSGRTKRIGVRYLDIRVSVQRDNVKIEHVSSERQHADTLPKSLSIGSIERHEDFLSISKGKREGATIG